MIELDKLRVGEVVPELEFGPVSRATLALFAGASGDHNPVHIDIDFARKVGAGDVFAHGLLSMAVLGRLLTNWVPQEQIRAFGVRFTSITHVHRTLRCTGTVIDVRTVGNERRLRLQLAAITEDGKTLDGWAEIAG